jgi:two-component system NarL family response regulator
MKTTRNSSGSKAEPKDCGCRKDAAIRVLLADDHKTIRDGLVFLLERNSDVKVIAQAENGQMALDMARELKPDVILMDVSMPVLDGIEATRIITSELHTPVIAISMHAAQGDEARSMREAGAVDYLSKSGPPELFIAAIHRNSSPLHHQVDER